MKSSRRMLITKVKLKPNAHAVAKRQHVQAMKALVLSLKKAESLTDAEAQRAEELVAAARRAKKAQFLDKYRAAQAA